MKFFRKYFLSYLILIIFISFSKEAISNNQTELSTNNAIKTKYLNLNNYLPKYFLGPGDVLSVKIYKFNSFNSKVTIMPDGNVNLPRIKPLSLNGLTIDRANNLITNEYKKILKNPIVYIDLLEARPIRVSISGEVQRPGIYSLNTSQKNEISNTDGGESIVVESKGWPSVIELIQKAGGLSIDGDLRNVKLKRFNREKNKIDEITINFWETLTGGGLIRSYPVFDGDSVFVSKNIDLSENEKSKLSKSNLAPSTISVNVIGEVNKPGMTTISSNSPIQNAILNAGGFTTRANKSKISLLRLDDNGKISKTVFNSKNNNFEKDSFLKDRDVVFIDNNFLSKTTVNLKSAIEPISPLVNAATIYKVFFGD